MLIGFGAFFISALYQFGNNLGVHSALQAYVDWNYIVVIFNAAAIAFLFAFKDLYKALERAMSVFVGLMLIAFAVNLWFAGPDLGKFAGGFVPATKSSSGKEILDLNLLGLIGTTFVITAAYYQSYLARFKGWNTSQLKEGLVDARVGSLLMAMITLMIMSNAAAAFFGKIDPGALGNVNDVAAQLEDAFGPKGRAIFCIGLFSAAYSSFLVNSMIGGFILADGLGLGKQTNRPLAAAVHGRSSLDRNGSRLGDHREGLESSAGYCRRSGDDRAGCPADGRHALVADFKT